jgi:hypothetical protein
MKPVSAAASRGYPLISLFLVITACGIVAALMGPTARAIGSGSVSLQDAVLSSVASTVAVSILGGIVGLFHYRRARGFCWGLATGAVIGTFVGPLTLAPREVFGALLALSLGGAVVIVLISAAFRIASKN